MGRNLKVPAEEKGSRQGIFLPCPERVLLNTRKRASAPGEATGREDPAVSG